MLLTCPLNAGIMIRNIDWNHFFEEQSNQTYFETLQTNIKNSRNKPERVFPPEEQVFNAFEATSPKDIKVVILGQDPYHGFGQANGLSFSVSKGQKIPPSLRNIYKELALEYPDFGTPKHGDLQPWAEQGVLLLNAVLTVEESNANSHKDFGWHIFTDNAIRYVSDHCSNVVFILWGAFAQKKEALIDAEKHSILKSPHPSPLSARRGFFGCDHFKAANAYLESKGKTKVNWNLP